MDAGTDRAKEAIADAAGEIRSRAGRSSTSNRFSLATRDLSATSASPRPLSRLQYVIHGPSHPLPPDKAHLLRLHSLARSKNGLEIFSQPLPVIVYAHPIFP